jgi:hypothetical protein
VARLEIPVRTALRFVKGPLPARPAWHEAESVIIEFEARQFGWVERKRFPHQDEHEPPPRPLVTTSVENGTEAEWDRAADAEAEPLQRLLSALAFHYNTRIESRRTKGGSGESDLLHPYGAVELSDTFAGQCVNRPVRVHVEDDPQLRVALGLYREGMSAGSPFYRFLAFWNVLDAVFNGVEFARDAFLRAWATGIHEVPNAAGTDVAKYLRLDSRHAIAHVVRDRPQDTTIDPDMPADRERLELDAYCLHDLARIAVLERWPEAVILEDADGNHNRTV